MDEINNEYRFEQSPGGVSMRWTLSIKIALGIAVILIASMGISVALGNIIARNKLMADYRDYTINLSELAQTGFEDAMMIKDPDKIKKIIQAIGTRAHIAGVAVFNKRGEIKYSHNPDDVGRIFSKNDPTCAICHDRTLNGQTQTVILPSKQGARIMKVVQPIINQPKCQGCHQERVLGMLMVDLSLAEVDQLAAAVLGQQIQQSLMTVTIVIAALIGFMYLIVTRPLAYFLRITRAIADGDLSRRVNITAKDEIGELGASFNSMTQNILARTQELERLNKIAATELTERKRAEELLEEERRRLQQALDEVRTLRGIVPICSYCKKIRDDEGYWKQVEQYVSEHTEAKFSHGICPACFEKEMNELKS